MFVCFIKNEAASEEVKKADWSVGKINNAAESCLSKA